MDLEKKVKKFEIKIDHEKCKGCKLCIHFCKFDVLEIDKISNQKGYFPIQVKNKENCTGCGNCYIICPEGICIEVYRKYTADKNQ
ncbi:MAG: 4Fe-4S binding protein [Candidatus Nanoarchaeia archaeon]|nr:4Fe-4S binding protein [Candidatus Nanoarchaeia archaeon]MDD5741353.1 4Fe-4S binding protein [Candidatus Nanoarchaeia archaeon]